MKLSTREKLMVTILGVAALTYGAATYLVGPQYDRTLAAHATRAETKQKLSEYQQMVDPNNPVFFEYKKMDNKVKDVSALFFPELKQDKIITVLESCFISAGVTPKTIDFKDGTETAVNPTDTQSVAVTQPMITQLNQIKDGYNGKVAQAPAVDPNAAAPAPVDPTQNAKPVQLKATIIFESSYEAVSKFIMALEGYPRRIVINNVESIAGTTGGLSTTVEITFMAIPKLHDQDGDFNEWLLANVYGKSNPFTPFSGYVAPSMPSVATPVAAAASSTAVKSDIFMLLSSAHADTTSVLVGRSTDKTRNTYVYADGPGFENVICEFTEADGRYFYKYRTQNDSYPKNYQESVEFKPVGSSIGLDIFSSKRVVSDDKCGANITLINKTKRNLVVTIRKDDAKMPRAKIVQKTGAIEIRQEQ